MAATHRRRDRLALLPALTFAIACCPGPRAQEQDPSKPDPSELLEQAFDRPLLNDVRARLLSNRPRTLAWGGYLAGEHGLRELVRELHGALEMLAGEPNRIDVRCARVAILDALCRLDLDLPDELIAALENDRALQPALMLLVARRPAGRMPILLRWLQAEARNNQQGRYLAAGHLLSLEPSEEFVAHLLDRIQISVDINVVDLHDLGFGHGRGAGFGMAGFHPPKIPQAMPPIAIWRFADQPGPGDVMVAMPGRGDGEPVHITRKVCHTRLQVPRDTAFSDDHEQILVWLERCAATPGSWRRLDTGWDSAAYIQIDLKTERFQSAADRLIAEWRSGYDRLLAGLRGRGLLGDPPAPPLAELFEVQLHDLRSDRIGPLPPLHWPASSPIPTTLVPHDRPTGD